MKKMRLVVILYLRKSLSIIGTYPFVINAFPDTITIEIKNTFHRVPTIIAICIIFKDTIAFKIIRIISTKYSPTILILCCLFACQSSIIIVIIKSFGVKFTIHEIFLPINQTIIRITNFGTVFASSTILSNLVSMRIILIVTNLFRTLYPIIILIKCLNLKVENNFFNFLTFSIILKFFFHTQFSITSMSSLNEITLAIKRILPYTKNTISHIAGCANTLILRIIFELIL